MVNVALLGCGRWGSNHLRTLARLRDSGIVGKISVVDISETVRNQAELADFTATNIDDVDADLVIIATPSNLHSKQAIEMIRKGKHVLVEKPLGKSEYEAAEVISTAQENGKILTVGLLLRFHPVLSIVQNLISTGKLGRIESMRFVRRSTRTPASRNNVIEALGVHGIDMVCHLMGEVEPSAINVEGDEIESRIALEFPHGIEALIDVAWNASVESSSVTIVGSNAKIVFELNNHESATLYKDGEEFILQCESNYSPLEAEIRHIIQGINAQKEGGNWTQNPSIGAVLRGVRWTEKALASLPHIRPH